MDEFEKALEASPEVAVENEFDGYLQSDKQAAAITTNIAVDQGLKKNPAIAAEAVTIANRLKLPADFVEANIDSFREKSKKSEYDYEELSGNNPALADWLQDPNHVAVSRNDLGKLKDIESNSRLIGPNELKKTNFAVEMGQAAQTGWHDLSSSAWQLGLAYGKIDLDTAAEQIAAANKKAKDIRANMPDYATEFNQVMQKEGGDVTRAKDRFVGGFEDIRKGRILKALQNISVGGAETVGESIDLLFSAVTRPKGLLYSSTKSAAFSLPAIATGLATAKAGAVGGAAVGSAFPGIGTAVGAGVGGTLGMGAGTFAGSVGTEIGAWVNQELEARGYDLTNPADIKRAYSDPAMIQTVLAEAERKGVTTAGVDAMFSLVAGKFIAGTKGAGIAAKMKGIAKDVGTQMAGEAVSEGAGQFAADGELDLGAALQEGITSMGSSVTQSTGAAVVKGGVKATEYFNELNPELNKNLQKLRDKFSKNPIKAAEEIVQEFDKSTQSESQLAALQNIGNAVKELKDTKNAEGAIKKLVNLATTGEQSGQVFFQTDDWDKYWNSKGESPAVKAAELGPEASKAYEEAKANGTDFQVDSGEYIEKLAPTEHFDGLMGAVKTTSDGKNLAEIKQMNEEIADAINQVAKEAEELTKKKETPVKTIVTEQLKEAGFKQKDAAIQASIYDSFSKQMAKLVGKTPLEFYSSLNLNINKMEGKGENIQVTPKAKPKVSEVTNKPIITFDPAMVDKLEGYSREVADDLIEATMKNMAAEIEASQAGQRSGKQVLNEKDGEGYLKNINTSSKSTFPKWAAEIGLNSKKKFAAAMERKSGAEYERIRAKAMDILVNGYESAQNQVLPENEFRWLLGMPSYENQDEGEFTLFQDEGTPNGRIRIGDKEINIDLFGKANPSTFLHETGHLWLEVMGRVFNEVNSKTDKTVEQEQFIKDANTTMEFLGVKSFDEITSDQHELWARSVEKYFGEGKAPTPELQSAFTRFKVWLVDVYKQLIYAKAPLNQEIRDVMNRLLAAQEAVADAEPPRLFDDAREAGLSKEKAAAYEQARNEWRMQAEEKLTKQLMDDLKKKEAAQYKKEFKEWEAKYREELSNQRVYKAISFLTDKSQGEGMPRLLNPATISKDLVKRMPKYLLSKKGMDAKLVAGLLGYENVSQMATELADNPDLDTAAKMNAEAEMRQRYPDRLNEADLREHAEQVVNNDMRSKLLRTELQMLIDGDFTVFKDVLKASVKRLSSNKEIKRQAEKSIAGRQVNNIKPYVFRNAEKKASKVAAESLAKGDINATFEAKKKELLNYEMARASQEALDQLDKFYEKFDKINQKDEKLAKSRDINFIYAARAIMSKYELSELADNVSPALEQFKQYDPMGWESIMALTQTVSIEAKPYDQLTYAEITEIHDVVNSLWDLARSSKEIEVDGKKMNKEQAKAELIFGIGEATKKEYRPGYDKAATAWDKTKVGLLGFKSTLRRVESWTTAMDRGAVGGAFRKYIWTPISEASDKYREEKSVYMVKFRDLTEKISKSIEPTPINAPELGYEFKDKGELLGALLHTGNESNLKKLLLGRGWGTQNLDGSLNTQKWQNFMNRMYRENQITKTEMDYIQGVWDLMEELKPGAQKAHKKLYGFYFDEITANEIKTPFGDYRGGYAPAVTDSFMVEDSAMREEQAAFEQQGNSFMFPATGKGFTMSRVEGYTKPLVMDLRLFPQHLDKVLRFTHIQPKISEVSSLVMDKEFRDALYGMDPTIGSELLVPWLQRAAQQKVETPAQGRGWKHAASVAKALRTNAGLQTMVFNITNALQQFTGFSIAAVKVKPKYLRNALWSYTRNSKQMAAEIAEKSSFMAERCGSQLFDAKSRVDEIILNPTKYDKFKDFAREHGYFFQAAFQGVVDNVTWQAAYDESVEMGLNEKDAVRRANSVVRETQGSFNAEDISEFEAGSAFRRLFTMFYSYFNMQANLLGTEFSNTYNEMGLRKGAGRMLYIYSMGFMIPAVLSELIVKAMSGKYDNDDDDEYLDDTMSAFFGSQVRSSAALVPFVGPTIMASLNTFNDKAYDDRISTSPAISMLESAARAPKSVYDAIADDGSQKRATRDLMTLLGLMSGVPLLPAAKPVVYLNDVSNGDAEPTGPIDFGRGIITGKSGQ